MVGPQPGFSVPTPGLFKFQALSQAFSQESCSLFRTQATFPLTDWGTGAHPLLWVPTQRPCQQQPCDGSLNSCYCCIACAASHSIPSPSHITLGLQSLVLFVCFLLEQGLLQAYFLASVTVFQPFRSQTATDLLSPCSSFYLSPQGFDWLLLCRLSRQTLERASHPSWGQGVVRLWDLQQGASKGRYTLSHVYKGRIRA